MMTSMTAYAASEITRNDLTVHTQIRSLNHKYLDVVLRIPRAYESLEEKIKALITAHMSRGRIEVRIKTENGPGQALAFEVNEPLARAYRDALAHLKETLGLDDPLPLGLFADRDGLLVPVENDAGLEEAWSAIQESVMSAINDLNRMRQQEGAFIADDLNGRIDAIEKSLQQIEAASSDLPALYRDRLQERITALTEGVVEIDPGRIAQEAAFLADRSDISEEIVRSKSHIKQFRLFMASPEPAGRKLNFLLQEFNREFNTMGSKTGNADVSHMIVAVKAEIEKIREQVQNIE